jgi:hypothetical protein
MSAEQPDSWIAQPIEVTELTIWERERTGTAETMSRLDPRKLHVQFASGVTPEGPRSPRRYTPTHSNSPGDLLLTFAPEVDWKQISGWYTRLMRDEVVAEWREGAEERHGDRG